MICMGNQMISSAIWNNKNKCKIFSKTNKISQACRGSAIWGLWKNLHACANLFQIVQEKSWIFMKNRHEKILYHKGYEASINLPPLPFELLRKTPQEFWIAPPVQ